LNDAMNVNQVRVNAWPRCHHSSPPRVSSINITRKRKPNLVHLFKFF